MVLKIEGKRVNSKVSEKISAGLIMTGSDSNKLVVDVDRFSFSFFVFDSETNNLVGVKLSKEQVKFLIAWLEMNLRR